MTNYSINVLDNLPKDFEENVNQGHMLDEAAHGIVCNYQKFYLVLFNEINKMIGVLSSYAAFAEIYVDDIWVDSNHRKLGLGRKLLEHLENHFEHKGFNNINLVTNHFQAPGFYEKCGYILEFVRENKIHPKLTKYFFIKYFTNSQQHQGILT